MFPIHIHSQLKSIKSTRFVKNSSPEKLQGGGYRVYIQPQYLLPEEADTMIKFCALFKVKPQNFGVSLYDENLTHTFYSYPIIGINEDGVLGLQIGSDVEGTGVSGSFIPMEYKASDNPQEVGTYYFGNLKAELGFTASSFGEEKKMRAYVVIRMPQEHWHIPFKASKDGEIDNKVLVQKWIQGHFHEVCRSLKEVNYKPSLRFTNAFSVPFRDRTFPRNGVVLILGNPKKIINEYNGEEKISTVWRILHSSHPLLSVQSFKDKEAVETLLSNCGSIFFNQNTTPTEEYLYYERLGQAVDYCLLHVISPAQDGSKKPRYDWSPLHFATCEGSSAIDFNDRILKLFREEVIEFCYLLGVESPYEKQSSQLIPTHSSTRMLNPSSEEDVLGTIYPEVVAEEVNDSDIPFDYPLPKEAVKTTKSTAKQYSKLADF